MQAMIKDWPVISREQIGDFRLFSLNKKTVRSPRTGEIREVQALQFPDWVLILAFTQQEEIVMVRQYRHGTEQVCLELPGGLVDPGDDSPELSAQRELLEETGYQAGDVTLLGECCPQPAILTNKCLFFLAQNVVRVQAQNLDAGEDIEILKIPLREIPAKIRNEEIDHGMVLLAFFFFWMKQGQIG
jgi:8-oxo-dGTP pyrophosphatase MutT (NUDIX family)